MKEDVILYRVWLVFLFSFVLLHAETVVKITSDSINLDDFKINYFIDHSQNMTIEDVQKETFEEGKNRLSLGINAHVTWVKIILQNDTESAKKLYIHDTYAYHASCTSFYAFDSNKTLLEHISYEPRKNINTDLMDGAIASFSVVLKPYEEKTVYVKSEFLAYQIIELKIFDNQHAKENLIHEYMIIIILTTILLTLAGYYSILYVASRHEEYIYYTLYLVSSGIFIAYSYGMLSHYFHVYGQLSLYLNATILIAPIFLVQFVKTIFNTKENHPLENHLLNSIIVIFGGMYLYSFIYYYKAMEWASFIYIYLLVVMMFVGISLYKKSVLLIEYFLLAHSFYIVASIVALMFYNAIIPFTYVTSHAVAIGTLIEAFLLAFLVSYRIRMLEEENYKKDKMILTDIMTALYNKSYFEEALNSKLTIQRREKNILALMVIDIDYFKQYNDTYGHIAGDEALRSVATVLKETLSNPDDMAFRIGGEEFALICTNMNKKSVLSCAQKLQKNIENLHLEHKSSDVSNYLTVSIGIHFASTYILEDAKKVYAHADEALYSAKKEGRNKVIVYGDIHRIF